LRPAWISHRTGTFTGVGGPEPNKDDAEAKARQEVVKQIEVSITGTGKFRQEESTGGTFAYSVSSTVVESIDLSISGLEIKELFFDDCRHRYYALATLNVPRAENGWHQDLRDLDSQAKEFQEQVDKHQKRGEAFATLVTLYRLMDVEETASQIETRLTYLTGTPVSGPSRSGKVKQVLSEYEALLGSLRIEIEGDRQQAVEGPDLPHPLVVRVLAGTVPIPHVPVIFTASKEASVTVTPQAWTDEQGQARGVVHYQQPSDHSASLEASVALGQVSQGFPAPLIKRLEQHKTQLTKTFTVLPPVYHFLAELHGLTEQIQHLHKSAEEAQTQGNVFRRLAVLDELMGKQQAWRRLADRVRAVSPAVIPDQETVGHSEASRNKAQTLLSSLTLVPAKGDGQSAVVGRPLSHPLLARVMAGGVPLPNVPVEFHFVAGNGQVDAVASTNAEGLAQAIVHQVEPAKTNAAVTAQLAWTRLPSDLPVRLKEQLQRHLRPVTFTIKPPWGCKARDPFASTLYEAACALAEQVNQSLGASIVVTDFVESTTSQPTPLGHRLEEGMAEGLVLSGAVNVIQVRGGQDGTDVPVAAVVSGAYGESQDQGIWIDARLVRKADQGTEAVLPGKMYISRSALSPQDLPFVNPRRNAESLVPLPRPKQPFHDWIEQFWSWDNPQTGFHVELEPLEKAYRVGENAHFRFRTKKTCYLTLVNIGTSGTWTVLLPNPYQPDVEQTRVQAGSEWRMIPRPQDGFEFTVGPPLGVERVKALCSTTPVSIIEGMDFSENFFQLSPERQGWRDLRPSQAKDWATAQAKVNTLAAGQTETKGRQLMRSLGLMASP